MSANDPIGSVPAERPKNPTHFGGEGLYEAKPESAEALQTGEDASLKVPLGEQVDSAVRESLEGEPREKGGSLWEFARRNHVPTVLAVGGLVWLLAALLKKSSERV